MKKTSILAIILASMLSLTCSRDTTPSLAFSPDPSMPAANPLRIVPGCCAFDASLSIGILDYKDTIEKYLGAPTGQEPAFVLYYKNGVTYKVRYSPYLQTSIASEIQVWCDRFAALYGNGTDLTKSVTHGASKQQVEAVFGAVTREEAGEWWYDGSGIAFLYDNNSRVQAVHIYPEINPVSYSIDSLWVSNGIDSDHDGYLSSYRLNCDIDISTGSESLTVKIYFRNQGESSWSDLAWHTFKVQARSTDNDSWYFTVTGADQDEWDYLYIVYNSSSTVVASDSIQSVFEESAANDSGSSSPSYLPLFKNAQWVYFYSSRTFTSGNPPRSTTDTGTITWDVFDTARYTADSIVYSIRQTTILTGTYGTTGFSDFDSLYSPAKTSLDTVYLVGSENNNGLRFKSDSCWTFFRYRNGTIPTGMFTLNDSTKTVLDVSTATTDIQNECKTCNLLCIDITYKLGEGVGIITKTIPSPSGKTGTTTSSSWTLRSTNVR